MKYHVVLNHRDYPKDGSVKTMIQPDIVDGTDIVGSARQQFGYVVGRLQQRVKKLTTETKS